MNPYPQGGIPPNVPQYPPPVQHVVHYHVAPPKSVGGAVALELVPGFLFQTFGIGNMYAGNIGAGIGLMLGYWFLTFINILLCFIFIGFITWPLTWILFMIMSPIIAASSASRSQ